MLVIVKTEGGQVEDERAELALSQCAAYLEQATGKTIAELNDAFRENARISNHADNDEVAALMGEAWDTHGAILPGDYMLAFV